MNEDFLYEKFQIDLCRLKRDFNCYMASEAFYESIDQPVQQLQQPVQQQVQTQPVNNTQTTATVQPNNTQPVQQPQQNQTNFIEQLIINLTNFFNSISEKIKQLFAGNEKEIEKIKYEDVKGAQLPCDIEKVEKEYKQEIKKGESLIQKIKSNIPFDSEDVKGFCTNAANVASKWAIPAVITIGGMKLFKKFMKDNGRYVGGVTDDLREVKDSIANLKQPDKIRGLMDVSMALSNIQSTFLNFQYKCFGTLRQFEKSKR